MIAQDKLKLRTFDGGVAIVTGAASGIGRAVSEELAAHGCEVILGDIETADAETVAGAIRQRGGQAIAHRLDVTDFESVAKLVNDTIASKGRLDYLFNNAGIVVTGEAAEYTLNAWRRIIEINLMGVVHGVQAAYPAMIRQGFGHIVNTASMAGLITMPMAVSYSATKHAVVGLSKALRAEAHSHGVRISVACPGAIRTPILQGGKHGILLLPLPEQQQRKFISDKWEPCRPMDPSAFAKRLLHCVARNVGIIVIPTWYRLLWWIERLLPDVMIGWLTCKTFEIDRKQLDHQISSKRPG